MAGHNCQDAQPAQKIDIAVPSGGNRDGHRPLIFHATTLRQTLEHASNKRSPRPVTMPERMQAYRGGVTDAWSPRPSPDIKAGSVPTSRARWLAVLLQVVILGIVLATFGLQIASGEAERVDWLDTIGFATWVFAFSVVGVLIVFHRPRNPISWACLGFGLVWSVWVLVEGLLLFEGAHPGSVSQPALLAALAYPLWVPGVGLVAWLLLRFPDGRLPSHRWRPVEWLLTAAGSMLFVTGFFLPGPIQGTEWVNPLGMDEFARFADGPVAYVLVVILMLSLGASAIALVVRYLTARGVERLQLKWLVAAATVSAVGYALMFVQEYTVQLVWTTIPVAIGLSMHRHRLYDIDRLVSRTLSYGLVVGTLAAVYVGAVFLLGNLFGFEGDVAVALSTLTAAVLFAPLRRRIQTSVDRRFNRSRYDADHIIEGLVRALRDATDSEEVVNTWFGVVTDTMQPRRAGVWLRAGDQNRPPSVGDSSTVRSRP